MTKTRGISWKKKLYGPQRKDDLHITISSSSNMTLLIFWEHSINSSLKIQVYPLKVLQVFEPAANHAI